MAPLNNVPATTDALLETYREITRQYLRQLMLKENLHPGHPDVVAYNVHLQLSTAHEEYQQWASRASPGGGDHVRADFYRGCGLHYTVPCKTTATSIEDDYDK